MARQASLAWTCCPMGADPLPSSAEGPVCHRLPGERRPPSPGAHPPPHPAAAAGAQHGQPGTCDQQGHQGGQLQSATHTPGSKGTAGHTLQSTATLSLPGAWSALPGPASRVPVPLAEGAAVSQGPHLPTPFLPSTPTPQHSRYTGLYLFLEAPKLLCLNVPALVSRLTPTSSRKPSLTAHAVCHPWPSSCSAPEGRSGSIDLCALEHSKLPGGCWNHTGRPLSATRPWHPPSACGHPQLLFSCFLPGCWKHRTSVTHPQVVLI